MSTSKRFGRLSHPILKGIPYGGVDRRFAQKKRAQEARGVFLFRKKPAAATPFAPPLTIRHGHLQRRKAA